MENKLPAEPQHKKGLLLLIGIAFIALSGAGIFVLQQSQQPAPSVAQNFLVSQPQPLPVATPDPFAELTIPYLRSRSYSSRLGLLQQASETTGYTAYLTSYDSDGLRVNGLLTKPKGQVPIGGWPAIVFVHGYIPPAQYRTTQNYAEYVDYLARNGFVVFKIDLRGHGSSDGEPGGGYYSGDYVIDTLNARAALQATDFVHQNKIGLWGHSMSGNVIFRAFTAKPEIPAIVIWAGAVYTYSDMQEFGINDNSYQPPRQNTPQVQKRQRLRELHGNFDPDDPFWYQVAPTNYLQDLRGAIQINHAVDDPVVPIGYSQNLMKLLDATIVPHELKEYASGGHNLTGTSFAPAMQNTVEFFEKYLDR